MGCDMTKDEIRAALCALLPGDHIRVNDWNDSYTVRGVSPHYVVADYQADTEYPLYTILAKEPTEIPRNGIPAGAMVCGPDSWVFGYWGGYNFEQPNVIAAYLESLESGETEISLRHRAEITHISKI